ncbi:hypothetical protein MXM41_14060 [Leclercia adecarboxylata]|uniref:hypothetical protein n=1 Tax=Leclercia adecarboxylata TaxID=83655 RepID=UPI002DBD9430|nr:hypothetical protein [Leclercia adecarboxylata]MEB6380049.1 hypothetical protein [Leclercia adecarboxylata]
MLSLNFEVPGCPEDYYEVKERDGGLLIYKPIRSKIRALAKTQCDYFDYISSIGENTHIATLESNDAIKDFFENEPEEAQICIYNTLAEEFDVITATINEKTAEINKENQNTEQAAENIGKIIGAMILAGFVIFIFSQLT